MRTGRGDTRVMVVDDQDLIRMGLVALLRAAPGIEVVGEQALGSYVGRMTCCG